MGNASQCPFWERERERRMGEVKMWNFTKFKSYPSRKTEDKFSWKKFSKDSKDYFSIGEKSWKNEIEMIDLSKKEIEGIIIHNIHWKKCISFVELSTQTQAFNKSNVDSSWIISHWLQVAATIYIIVPNALPLSTIFPFGKCVVTRAQ